MQNDFFPVEKKKKKKKGIEVKKEKKCNSKQSEKQDGCYMASIHSIIDRHTETFVFAWTIER